MAQNDIYAKEAYLGVPYSALLQCVLEPFGEVLSADAQATFHTNEILISRNRIQVSILYNLPS